MQWTEQGTAAFGGSPVSEEAGVYPHNSGFLYAPRTRAIPKKKSKCSHEACGGLILWNVMARRVDLGNCIARTASKVGDHEDVAGPSLTVGPLRYSAPRW